MKKMLKAYCVWRSRLTARKRRPAKTNDFQQAGLPRSIVSAELIFEIRKIAGAQISPTESICVPKSREKTRNVYVKA